MKINGLLIGMALSAGLVATGCTTTTTNPPAASAPSSDKRQEISVNVHGSLDRLYSSVRGSRDLVSRSRAVLVFPNVVAAGLGIGGEYGEGELLVNGQGAGYYKTITGSIGFQAGAQSKAVYFVFTTQDALDKFRAADGWTAGVDGSVALLKVGANGELDSNSVRAPISCFVMTNAGLMVNATIEGTKVSRLR